VKSAPFCCWFVAAATAGLGERGAPLVLHLRIDHRVADVAMPRVILHFFDAGPVLEQQRAARVAAGSGSAASLRAGPRPCRTGASCDSSARLISGASSWTAHGWRENFLSGFKKGLTRTAVRL
jgi:hypothetical protein